MPCVRVLNAQKERNCAQRAGIGLLWPVGTRAPARGPVPRWSSSTRTLLTRGPLFLTQSHGFGDGWGKGRKAQTASAVSPGGGAFP